MIPSRFTEYEHKFAKSQAILSHLNQRLSDQSFLLGNGVSLADISVYVYTHLSEEGGLDLLDFEHLRTWFGRIDGFVRM